MEVNDYQPEPDTAKASTIPRRWYVSPEFLHIEREKIFRNTWQALGHVQELARPGDFMACEVQGEPIVLTHTLEGRIRAYSNVCRHRAHPVATGKGNRKSLQCGYHGWTYDLSGKLLAAPEFEGVENWSKSDVCLPEIQADRWGPHVFVNLGRERTGLKDFLGKIPAEVNDAGIPVDQMVFVERRDYVVSCNWKVYIDNYLEGYHIPMAHPGLFREIDYAQYRVDTFRYYSSAHAPIRALKEGETAGRDRRYVRSKDESRALYYWIFPNFMINIYPDNLQANIVLPINEKETLTIFEWFFLGPGSGEGWESLQQSIAFSDQIQQEDMEICKQVQRGLQSQSYSQGRLSLKRENGVHHFHLLLHEFLSQ
jgi:phenylpropionate dioxygenase-like ring-hydroxylating dioxygenase large terminal subunit